MFYRIFGAEGHGKTSYVYDRLSEGMPTGKKSFLVVPEQSAVATEKELLRRLSSKSNMSVEVINFKRLCNRVFRELGGLNTAHLDDGAKKLLMMLVLDKISPFLREYNKSTDGAEFAEKALAALDEMKSARVTPKELERAAEELEKESGGSETAAKLYDLALISESFDGRIEEIPDGCADIYQKLCDKLRENDFFSGCDVYFDSFYGFTAREYEIISLIAESADNTYVTFNCKKDCSDPIFKRSSDSARMCKKIAERVGCEVCDIELEDNMRHEKDGALYRFAGEFCSDALTDSVKHEVPCDGIEAVLCRDTYDEARCAVSTVLDLVRKGASFSDIAICAKNTEDYIGIIDTAFEKAGVPLGIDIPETLGESALFELVTSALEAASTFRNEPILRYIKTGLSGLSEEQADVFEIYIRTWDISPSLMKKDEDFTMNPDGYVDTAPDENLLSVVNSARSKVHICLDSLSKNIKKAKTVRDYAQAVYNLTEDIRRIGERETFFDGNGGVSLELLYRCLDSFVLCGGDEVITPSRFLTLFKSCGKNYDTGHIPQRRDEVSFSSVELVRCSNIPYVILLGANSGIFPSSSADSSLLSDNEKKKLSQLGIKLGESREEKVFDEFFLAYSVISSASKGCFILYSAEDTNSSALFPSAIVSSAMRICAKKPVEYSDFDIEKSYPGNEMLFEELLGLENGKRRDTLMRYFSSIPEYNSRMNEISKLSDQPDRLMSETTDLLYENTLVTSYSRLEKMAQCPFSHFCTYTLRLKEEPKAQLGPAEAGSVMHKILEELVPLLCTRDENGSFPDENEAKELVNKLLCEYLGVISHADLGSIPKRFVYLYNRLSRLLYEMAANIVKELRVSKFEPRDFELDISRHSDVKPVPVDIGSGTTLYIIGQVDRVDVYEKDGAKYIRIIDYKTGKKSFKLKDIEKGFNLQMLLYLEAIRKSGNERYGDNIIPAGVLYSNVVSHHDSLMLGEDDIDEMSGEVSKPVSSGIFLDDEQILFAMDPTENSTFLPIGRKNGVATKTEALADAQRLGELLDFATGFASELAAEMRSGLKSVTPFDGKREGIDIDPCGYCPMRPVCMKQ